MRTEVRDPDGSKNVYAGRILARQLADAYYLGRQRVVGHAQASQETCELMGHDARGGKCDRCGRGVSAVEVRSEKQANGTALR